MAVHNILGKKGEDAASFYLQKHGYVIIERNFRLRNGEIDIIAIDNSDKEKVLAFIEVKTRTSNQFGTPLEAITYFKLKFLIRSAQVYKATHRGLPEAMRIDAISVILDSNNQVDSIELTKNISGF